ncbi:MAG: flavin reductase [Flagellimonas sp.]
MDTIRVKNYVSLNTEIPIWDRIFTVAPLIVIGTKEQEGYDLAPKHMATPLGFDNYFGFVCTPRHGTYQNVKKTGKFTVSFPKPDQVTTTSLSASPRTEALTKSQQIVESLPLIKAASMDAPLIKDAYLYLECELFKIIDGFGENSIITGKIKEAYVHNDYLRVSEKDEQEQLKNNPLLAYISYGRFAKIGETYNFPFPKDFKR